MNGIAAKYGSDCVENLVIVANHSLNFFLLRPQLEIFLIQLDEVGSLRIVIPSREDSPMAMLRCSVSDLPSMLFLKLGPGKSGVHRLHILKGKLIFILFVGVVVRLELAVDAVDGLVPEE